jgi:hypothetical protein
MKMAGTVAAAALGAAAAVAAAAPPIEAVVLHRGHGMGYGGAITVAYRARVLYADGRYTTDAKEALASSPRIDGRWQWQGGAYLLQPDKPGAKPERIEPNMKARPAARGATLQGEYRSLSGVGATGMNVPVVAAARALRFARDGTLTIQVSASAATGDVAATGHRSAAARYALDGWTITMSGSDGRADTRLFYFFPDSDDVIGVGGSTLSRRR